MNSKRIKFRYNENWISQICIFFFFRYTIIKWTNRFDSVENIVGKVENAGYQHFLLYPECFQKPFFPACQTRDCVVRVKRTIHGLVWYKHLTFTAHMYNIVLSPFLTMFCQSLLSQCRQNSELYGEGLKGRCTDYSNTEIWHILSYMFKNDILLLPQCFQNPSFSMSPKLGIVWLRVKGTIHGLFQYETWHKRIQVQKRQFLLLPQCFQKPSFTMSPKLGIVW